MFSFSSARRRTELFAENFLLGGTLPSALKISPRLRGNKGDNFALSVRPTTPPKSAASGCPHPPGINNPTLFETIVASPVLITSK